jgi:hypothetical protein
MSGFQSIFGNTGSKSAKQVGISIIVDLQRRKQKERRDERWQEKGEGLKPYKD